jgi:small subunit ribosomal protein S16
MGRAKRPLYAVVAADARTPRDGRFIEDLGRYEPLNDPAVVSLNEARVLYWLEQGAQPSDTVRSLLHRQGLLLALHLRRKGKTEEEVAAAVSTHRTHREDKDHRARSISARDRRRQMLEAERRKAAEAAAEEARRHAEADAQAKAAAEEARRQVEAERERAAAEARAAQQAANAAQAAADAATAPVAEAPAAVAPVAEAPVAEAPAAEAVAEAVAEVVPETPAVDAGPEEAQG